MNYLLKKKKKWFNFLILNSSGNSTGNASRSTSSYSFSDVVGQVSYHASDFARKFVGQATDDLESVIYHNNYDTPITIIIFYNYFINM